MASGSLPRAGRCPWPCRSPGRLSIRTGGASGWRGRAAGDQVRRLASFSRLLRYDRRGTGASDPLPPDPLPPSEVYTEELVAVMDATGSRRVALLATGPQAGPLGLFFAGTRPERTSALILADATARYLAADDYPIGFSSEAAEATIARAEEPWGSEAYVGSVRRAGPATSGSCAGRPGSSGPSPAHGWSGPICGPCCRSTSAPILPLIQAPTLVLAHREFQQLPVEHGRYLGEHIAGARLVELPGDLPLWVRPNRSWVLGVVEEFLIGARHGVEPDRVLATVLFTDIVGSTQQAAELGDRASPGHVAEREASRRSGHVRNQRQRTAAPAHPSGVHHRRGGMHPGGSAHPFCPVAAG
jgi:pimeloyl-ACP methyl ester carboxylesterase